MNDKHHWESVYADKDSTEVSWYQPHAALSVDLIRAHTSPSVSVIDIGGGASTLVDDLIAAGYTSITVLDIAKKALEQAQRRLDSVASHVTWLEADILTASLPEHGYDVWHDRAVFHFLTNEHSRRTYVRQVCSAVRPGGLVLVATFAQDGPQKCSGLDVMRYSAEELQAEFGAGFVPIATRNENHETPWGTMQSFTYCLFRVGG